MNVFVPLFGGGVMISVGDGFLTITLPLTSAVLFALPFWDLQMFLVHHATPLFAAYLKGVVVAAFVVVAVGLAAQQQEGLIQQPIWGSWQIAQLANCVVWIPLDRLQPWH